LYHSLGLPYPPPLDGALTAQGAPAVFAAAASVGASQPDGGMDDHQGDDDDVALAGAMEEGGGAHSRADDEGARGHLFRGLVFFLSREVNIEALSFMIRACGGRCGWDGQGSPLAEGDSAITHHVVDRPSVPAPTRALVDAHAARDGAGGRVFVQPQWVFDSVNFGIACPPQPYAVGAALPPHLSPFVQPTADGGYAPDFLDTVRFCGGPPFRFALPTSPHLCIFHSPGCGLAGSCAWTAPPAACGRPHRRGAGRRGGNWRRKRSGSLC
jgi:hypothetical protein